MAELIKTEMVQDNSDPKFYPQGVWSGEPTQDQAAQFKFNRWVNASAQKPKHNESLDGRQESGKATKEAWGLWILTAVLTILPIIVVVAAFIIFLWAPIRAVFLGTP